MEQPLSLLGSRQLAALVMGDEEDGVEGTMSTAAEAAAATAWIALTAAAVVSAVVIRSRQRNPGLGWRYTP